MQGQPKRMHSTIQRAHIASLEPETADAVEAVILLGQLNEAGMEDARAWIGWGRSFQKFDAQV